MKRFIDRNILDGGLLGLFLLLGMVSPLAFTSCMAPQPEIEITLVMDYSKVIQAINATNRSLTEKLSLIETALKNGFDENNTQQALLKQGYSLGEGITAPTGMYGPDSAKAVEAYQRDHGLEVTGVADVDLVKTLIEGLNL